MVTIIADTTSSLPLQLLAELQIPCLPQIIVFGEESFRDDTELNTAQFLTKLRASPTLPKTAAPPPALYTPIFQKILEKGGTALVVTPSAEVSGTYRSAVTAAQDFPPECIQIVDTRTIAGGLASIVLKAVEWAREEPDLNVLAEKVRELSTRQRIYFLVDTLEYLYKGGRIGGAQALLGGLLQVKPILTIKEGQAEPVESQRTRRRALARLKELVLTDCPRSPDALISVMHCDNEGEAKSLAADLSDKLGITDIPIYLLPPAIIVHAGPGALAVSYFRAKP